MSRGAGIYSWAGRPTRKNQCLKTRMKMKLNIMRHTGGLKNDCLGSSPTLRDRLLRSLPRGIRLIGRVPEERAKRVSRRARCARFLETASGPRWVLLTAALLAVAVGGCELQSPDDVLAPARMLYLEAETQENQGLYADAISNYEKVSAQFPGTRLATYAYLKLAEIYSLQSNWEEAETNYRLFLARNANSHLTPYLLYRLLKVNHEKSFTGVFFKEREVDRDMGPNRNIMLEYKRFFLLYPKSVYLDEVTPFFRAARQSLAEHERLVGDFYFERGLFNASIGRYRFLLRNYPEYQDSEAVLKRLVEAYRKNQQPQFAEELQRLQAIGESSPNGKSATTSTSQQ